MEDNIAIEGDGRNTTILIDHTISKHNPIIRADNKDNIKVINLAIMGSGIQNQATVFILRTSLILDYPVAGQDMMERLYTQEMRLME